PAAPSATGAPAAAAQEAAQAAPEATLDAAVKMVKDFPLDGGRGSVAQWLQYSYSASPDAGKEEWNASAIGGDSYLVEYHFIPAKAGGPDIHYLFQADMGKGFVIGKNLDAKRMLAGGSPAPAAKPAPRKPAKKAVRRKPRARRRVRRVVPRPRPKAEPKEVPLLPLPSEGELRPPAEDDGAFGTDTVHSGL
ncbi:MAG: hypothetical protein KGL53_10400, partial [Elusimicrobia bacterium]|nr:hypothetical protein [Elusimicrobiota bacterium]